MKLNRLMFTAVAVLATGGVMMTTTAYAQTSGMERRGDRRDNREAGRGDDQDKPEAPAESTPPGK